MLSLPGYFRLFPAYFRPFPGISTQKNRHISTQSRAKSAQKVRNSKLTTVVKKWQFPAPSQEIRPQGRNLANGQLFVSFRRSRYNPWINGLHHITWSIFDSSQKMSPFAGVFVNFPSTKSEKHQVSTSHPVGWGLTTSWLGMGCPPVISW
jgi:hypothetical protein